MSEVVADVACCQKTLEWLRERLLLRDQLSMFSSSQVFESMLELGMMRYVSCAYLTNMLPAVTALRSAALRITYAVGPMADRPLYDTGRNFHKRGSRSWISCVRALKCSPATFRRYREYPTGLTF